MANLLKDFWDKETDVQAAITVSGYNFPADALNEIETTIRSHGVQTNVSAVNFTETPCSKKIRYPAMHTTRPSYALADEATVPPRLFYGSITDSISLYSTLTCVNFQPRLYPNMQKATTVLNALSGTHADAVACKVAFDFYTDDQGRNQVQYKQVGGRKTIAQLINSLSDDVLTVNTYEIYTNNESQNNTKIGSFGANIVTTAAYDMYTPFQWTGTGSDKTWKTAFIGYLSSALNSSAWAQPNRNKWWLTSNVSKPLTAWVLFPKDFSDVLFKAGNYPFTLICGTKAQWSLFFKYSGFQWSWSLDDVINKPIINGPPIPGQPENPDPDPPGGGDNEDDPIEYPDVTFVPDAYSRYWISSPDIRALKDFLFSQTFLNDIQRLWQNPGEYIVDMTYYPLNPIGLGLTGESEDIVVGSINSGVSGLILPSTASHYVFAGQYYIEPYYNSYLDYEPFTTLAIYLPYIGIRPLNASRLNGHTLKVAYTFDFGTRQITAHLGIDGESGELGKVLDQYTGQFGVTFPLSGTQNNQMVISAVRAGIGVVTGAAGIVGGVATTNPASVLGGVGSVANSLTPQTIHPETYGTLSPTSGLYAPQTPYIIINRPITAEPAEFQNTVGYSSNYYASVSDFSGGYLKCAAVKLNSSAGMTGDEQREIIEALKAGVYV